MSDNKLVSNAFQVFAEEAPKHAPNNKLNQSKLCLALPSLARYYSRLDFY